MHKLPENKVSFNTQPPEGGWTRLQKKLNPFAVSTHSRPKAAGFGRLFNHITKAVSTHSRPKAAGIVVIGKGA